MATWQVRFQPGIIAATGFKAKKKVNVSELKTASTPANIRLSADRNTIDANGQDLSYVTVEITDANGILNPTAENLITFEINGPGKIIATHNANPVSLESFQLPVRKAWHGRCLVIIRADSSKGKVILRASSQGVKSAEIEINCN